VIWYRGPRRATDVRVVVLPLAQIGIDENGLGPRLGPMVVTAVRLELDGARVPDAAAFTAATTQAGIADSKAACAFGAMGAIEARVLAFLAGHLGCRPSTFTELVGALAHEDEASLRRDCPEGEAPVACFADPVPLPAFGAGPSAKDHDAATALRDAGVTLRAARVGLVCAKRMNVGKRAGQSRFDLDLGLMVALAGALRDAAADGRAVAAYCGKVGGRMRYASALEPLSPLVAIMDETRGRSSYRVPGFGEMHFVMDGDATEPAIGLASLVGKYVRELWMHRLNRYWLGAVPDATAASGYHDPVTARLVEATALVRRERGVPNECFER
jgi:ribonuclease HII